MCIGGYCELCDCVGVCDDERAVRNRRFVGTSADRRPTLTSAEKAFLFELVEELSTSAGLSLQLKAGAPDPGVMGIVL